MILSSFSELFFLSSFSVSICLFLYAFFNLYNFSSSNLFSYALLSFNFFHLEPSLLIISLHNRKSSKLFSIFYYFLILLFFRLLSKLLVSQSFSNLLFLLHFLQLQYQDLLFKNQTENPILLLCVGAAPSSDDLVREYCFSS